MIHLTRLNSKGLVLNSDLIKFIEQSPDTTVTLITGEKLVVLEKPSEVLARIVDFRRSLLEGLALNWDTSAIQSMIARSAESGSDEPKR